VSQVEGLADPALGQAAPVIDAGIEAPPSGLQVSGIPSAREADDFFVNRPYRTSTSLAPVKIY
jgi:hypothetical protein